MKTNRTFLTVGIISSALWLAGCESTPEGRIRENPVAFTQLSPQEQAMVKAGQVGLGFSAEAVKLALGAPTRVTVRTDEKGQTETWHYTETVYYDGAFIYGGPYWGGWGGGWGRRGWGWGGGYWGPYPVGPVNTYDHFRVEFRNGKVIAFSQETIP
jgi:hypothetical protein